MAHSGSSYRLDELGWLQFERLCSLLLEVEAGLSDLRWRGHCDTGRTARLEQELVLADRGIRLAGPTTVAVVWIPASSVDRGLERIRDFDERMTSLLAKSEDGLLVLTNLDRAGVNHALSGHHVAQRKRLFLLSSREIGASLDRDPRLRAALLSVLGLRDLEPLIDRNVLARSSLDVQGAQELARVFWPTRAYERAREVLGIHRFVVLTGPPEMGKTAIAQMLALAQLTDGWEAHECNDPERVSRAFDRERAQVFVADDAFGSTEYRPDAAERWARGLGRLLTMLDSRHWLIWTSRPAPLKAGLRRVQRERGSERFPAPGEVLVDASHLDLTEKTLILFRHAKHRRATDEARRLVRSAALSIVEHPHFTPERIRRFVNERLDQLPHLAAGGERELAATARRHHAGGLSRPPNELIDRLTDHFLRVTPLGVGWVHPSWRDLVIDELREDPAARRRFLEACGVDGITLALSLEGGVAGERTLPMLRSDADWDVLGDRLCTLMRELEDQEIARVLLALADALGLLPDEAQANEAQSLAAYVLGVIRTAWDQSQGPVPVFMLEAWYAVNTRLARRIESPLLGPTWAELHPGSALLEHPDRSELARADEWLALAQTPARYDPRALLKLSFFARDADLLARLIAALARSAADEDLRALSESVLARIEALVPQLAGRAHSAIEIGHLEEALGRKRWWVPEDIPAPPSREPVATTPWAVRRDFVARVLGDL